MIHSFDWRDFPSLHRHRNDGLCLDTTLALTRWMALVPAGALLATLAPATGVFTYVATSRAHRGKRVIGQFMHPPGSAYAKLTFITPEEDIESPLLPELLDYLSSRAGEHGAHNLLAEVNDRSLAFEVLRSAGFAIYTRQRIWHLTQALSDDPGVWRPAVERDSYNLHRLYAELVPPLVQQTEPPPEETLTGLVYEKDGEMLGYLHLSYGPRGVLAQPFLHPETTDIELVLGTIFSAVPNQRSRPLYLCVRSHHAWLSAYLDGLGYESRERQAVMVKRLAKVQKASLPLTLPATGLENAQPNASSSVLSSVRVEQSPARQPESEVQQVNGEKKLSLPLYL